MLYLRPATMEDSANLLAWRNDPETCANSRNTAAISPKRHNLWMEINVRFGYPTRIILIAETGDNVPVGVLDFAASDPMMKSYIVSITIAPKMRGRGYGKEALALGVKRMTARMLKAEIRSENVASRSIFRACGFKHVNQVKGFEFLEREAV